MMTVLCLSRTGTTGPSQPLTGDYSLLFIYLFMYRESSTHDGDPFLGRGVTRI